MSGTSVEAYDRDSRERTVVAALFTLLGITAAWWALALWPLPETAPGWVVRTRAVCFGSAPDGLPDAAGWIALIVQPALMFGILVFGWGSALRHGLGRLTSRPSGRGLVGLTALLMLAGLSAAGARVATAESGVADDALAAPRMPGEDYPRLARPAPELGLVDQHGETVVLADLRGRPLLVTFAFGHCSTFCPLIVRNTLAARNRLGELAPVLIVITLDPWRDTPARLPHIASRWELDAGAHVLSGGVEEVNRALDAWEVPRSRDPRTGDIVHPPLVYLVDATGRIAYAARGDPEVIAELARRL